MIQQFSFKALNFLFQKRKLFSWLLGILIVVVVIALIVYKFHTDQVVQRKIELFQLEQSLTSLSDDQLEQKQDLTHSFQEKFPQTKEAAIAQLIKAKTLVSIDPEKALAEYQQAQLFLKEDSFLYALTELNIITLYIELKQYSRAVKQLETTEVEFFPDLRLLYLAEAYRGLKNNKHAKTILSLFEKDFPKSVYREKYKDLQQAFIR